MFLPEHRLAPIESARRAKEEQAIDSLDKMSGSAETIWERMLWSLG
jgi:hypothetical protein